jgi:epoxyqueuosine reductase QueG
VAPVLTEHYDAFRSPEHAFASTWSERHVAYAAGLGQFGLNGSLITPLGANVRLGSVVTDMPVPPTARRWKTHRAPCLDSRGEACDRCIQKCPMGAVSAQGLDKSKCYAMRQAVRDRFLSDYARECHMLTSPVVKGGKRRDGYSLGCALCQCGVPCEGCFPEMLTRVKRGDA